MQLNVSLNKYSRYSRINNKLQTNLNFWLNSKVNWGTKKTSQLSKYSPSFASTIKHENKNMGGNKSEQTCSSMGRGHWGGPTGKPSAAYGG